MNKTKLRELIKDNSEGSFILGNLTSKTIPTLLVGISLYCQAYV